MRRHAITLAVLAAVACGSPPPPVIPPRETIGPPREAAAECKPPTRSFAQAMFMIADLDTGHSCEAFLEQDECVIALFRDCTDHDSSPPRSWQGAIDSGMSIELERTRPSSGSVMMRAPISCEGRLVDPEPDDAIWAKLDCRIAGGAGQAPHGGFYLEKMPASETDARVPPIGSKQEAIEIVQPSISYEDFVSDFAVFSATDEVWAIVDAEAGDDASGLYAGSLNTSARLFKVPSVLLDSPTVMRVSEDERFAAIADGTNLHRVEKQDFAVETFRSTDERIVDLMVLDDTILIASIIRITPQPASRLEVRRFSDLQPVRSTTIAFQVAELIETPDEPDRIAYLRLKEEATILPLGADLSIGAPIDLGGVPGPAAYASELDMIVYSLSTPTRLAILDLKSMDRTEMHLPEAGEPRSYFYDETRGHMLVGAKGGLLTAVDLAGKRPLLQSRIDLGATVSRMLSNARDDFIYVLRGPAGFIDPIAR